MLKTGLAQLAGQYPRRRWPQAKRAIWRIDQRQIAVVLFVIQVRIGPRNAAGSGRHRAKFSDFEGWSDNNQFMAQPIRMRRRQRIAAGVSGGMGPCTFRTPCPGLGASRWAFGRWGCHEVTG